MAEKFLGQNGLNKLITLIKNALGTKVDKVDGKGLSTNDYTTTEKNKLSSIASNAQVNVIENVQKNGTNITVSNKTVNITVPTKTSDITNDSGFITVSDIPEGAAASTTVPKMDGTAAVGSELAFARGDHIHPSDSTKVDKVSGKGLSTNDYTTAEKNKLSGIASGAQVNVIETVKVNGTAQSVTGKAVDITVPTAFSDLTNDGNFVSDANYVHTDSNFTAAEKTKLAGLATVATSGDYDDLTNKPTIPEEVFVATYNVTTNAEIYAAFQAKKVVVYYANGGLPCYLRSCRSDYAGFESLLDASGQVINYIVQNDHWTDLTDTYAKANAVENVVKYSTQSLSNSQKTQARTNIGAGTYSKPSGGIPDSDIASAATWNAKGTYNKPSGGIPDSDIASAATWNAKQNALTAGTDYLTPAQVNSAIDSKISSVYTPKGSIAFASLPTAAEGLIGDVYNITDAFTTTAAFIEGAGKTYPAGTNVVCVKEGSNYKWDVLAGFIDITEFTETEVQTIWDSVFNVSA